MRIVGPPMNRWQALGCSARTVDALTTNSLDYGRETSRCTVLRAASNPSRMRIS